jgi:dTDP-4-amino-4,6-dideoxygalactose transaminase
MPQPLFLIERKRRSSANVAIRIFNRQMQREFLMTSRIQRPERESFLVFGAPRIEREEIEEVEATLKCGWLGTGPRVARFETDFASYKSASDAAAVNSCTAALHLSMLAAGIGPGDEVITTALTFCATVNAIIHAGATPVLADVDPTTMNIDPEALVRGITPRTKAILPVHFAGRPCDMTAIMEIAAKRGLRVIEDCAHAIESEHRGLKTGTIGDFGCFSFYVTKTIVTGEGGMVLTRNEEDIARIRMLALHGLSLDAWKRFSDAGYKHYYVLDAGFKYNMSDIQAAIAFISSSASNRPSGDGRKSGICTAANSRICP